MGGAGGVEFSRLYNLGLSKVFNILRTVHKLSFIKLKVLPIIDQLIRNITRFILFHEINIIFDLIWSRLRCQQQKNLSHTFIL